MSHIWADSAVPALTSHTPLSGKGVRVSVFRTREVSGYGLLSPTDIPPHPHSQPPLLVTVGAQAPVRAGRRESECHLETHLCPEVLGNRARPSRYLSERARESGLGSDARLARHRPERAGRQHCFPITEVTKGEPQAAASPPGPQQLCFAKPGSAGGLGTSCVRSELTGRARVVRAVRSGSRAGEKAKGVRSLLGECSRVESARRLFPSLFSGACVGSGSSGPIFYR